MNGNNDALQAVQVAESLRRSAARNNTVTPTRTVRLTALEEQQQNTSRDTTPLAMAEGILVRSSVTRRSPRQQRRFESPLENAPIRGVDASPQRITIRPGAGNIVGDVLARNHGGGNHGEGNEDPAGDPSLSSKNAKLAHSHRKIRRWNNDRLVDLDISSSKVRQLFADAKVDAHHYKAIVNPLMEQKNTCYQRFLTEPSLQTKRDAFFSGEGPSVSEQRRNTSATTTRPKSPSLARLHTGLRRMVERAHRNSMAATKVLTVFEAFVVTEYYNDEESSHGSSSNMDGWWKDLLLEAPHVATLPNGKKQVEFLFDPVSHSGGFHRLLLSAVAQFHSIKAKGKNRIATRALILEGAIRQQQAPVVRLLTELANKERGSNGVTEPVRLSRAPGTCDADDFTLVDHDDGGGSSTTYVLVSDDDGSDQDAIATNSAT